MNSVLSFASQCQNHMKYFERKKNFYKTEMKVKKETFCLRVQYFVRKKGENKWEHRLRLIIAHNLDKQ